MLKVIIIPNSFNPTNNRDVVYHEWEGAALSEYIPDGFNAIVFVNQKREEDFSIIPHEDSEIIITNKQEDPVTAIATFFISALSSAFVTGPISGFLAVGLGYLAAGAVVIAGSRLLASVLTPQAPNSATQGIEQSQTYSWTQAVTRPNAGSPIPVIYGTMQTAGSIIQRRIEYVGDDEYLYLQLALCIGEIEDIQSADILINDNPITNYSDVEYLYANGNTNQDVMKYFGDIESPNDINIEFSDNNPVTQQISSNSAQALRIFIQFPNGIYYQNDNGGLDSRTVSFKVEYKLVSDITWTTVDGTINEQNTSSNDIYPIGLQYPPTSSTGTTVTDTWNIKAAQTSPVNRELRIDNLTPGQYEVRITRVTPISTDVRVMTKAQWTGIGAIIYDDLYYPNIALLGLRIKATGQLSGSVNVQTTVTRKQIEVFDENSVSQGLKNLDNPAWVFWDALTNKIYGYGLNYNQVDYETINEWAAWCDELVDNGLSGTEKRAMFNGTFDFEGNLWDALCKIATIGRGAPIIKGTKYSVIVDKSAPMVQLFNMGNIIQDSLKINYVGDEDLANEVEVQFINKDNQYNNDTLSVVVPEWFTSTNQPKKTTINQMGITSKSQAYRIGRYFLNNNKNIRRTAEFKVALDAIDCEAGDVIGISHDVPMWGQSGRIVSATSNTVTIDKEVTLVDGSSYTFTIRHNDNTFETIDVIFTGTQTTGVLTLIADFGVIPDEYDIYSLIESPHTIKLFRISAITRESDDIRKVTAVEYNESIVSDDTTIIPTQNTSEFTLYPKITNEKITEHLEKRKDGTIIPYMDVSWDTASSSYGSSQYAIYLSRDEGLTYQKIVDGIKEKTYSIVALELQENKQFYIKVTGKSIGVDYTPLSQISPIPYTYLGKSAPPEDVLNFTSSIVKDNIVLTWDNVADVDLAGYQLTINGSIYNQGVTGTTFTIKPVLDSYEFKIKAIDTSGNLSVNYATTNINIDKPVVTRFYSEVIDNNVLLRWESTDGSMPIESYYVYKGSDFATSSFIGSKNGTFTTIFEREGGTFTYWVQAIDTAGIKSEEKGITTSVTQPPDYVLNVDWYSVFDGSKTNTFTDNGKLLLLPNTAETWEEHFINNSFTTPQDQINAGSPYYLQPTEASGQYQEVFDYGTTLSASLITVSPSIIQTSGVVAHTINIEVSVDNSTWILYSDTDNAYATNFRYVRVTLDFTTNNGVAYLEELNVRLDSKIINDAGTATADANDINGTIVVFNKPFVDVTSITVTPKSTSSVIAVYDFDDIPNQTQFSVYLFNNAGTRVSGDVSWSIKGY